MKPKTPSSLMFSHLLPLYFFFKHFENTLDFARCMLGRLYPSYLTFNSFIYMLLLLLR